MLQILNQISTEYYPDTLPLEFTAPDATVIMRTPLEEHEKSPMDSIDHSPSRNILSTSASSDSKSLSESDNQSLREYIETSSQEWLPNLKESKELQPSTGDASLEMPSKRNHTLTPGASNTRQCILSFARNLAPSFLIKFR